MWAAWIKVMSKSFIKAHLVCFQCLCISIETFKNTVLVFFPFHWQLPTSSSRFWCIMWTLVPSTCFFAFWNIINFPRRAQFIPLMIRFAGLLATMFSQTPVRLLTWRPSSWKARPWPQNLDLSWGHHWHNQLLTSKDLVFLPCYDLWQKGGVTKSSVPSDQYNL